MQSNIYGKKSEIIASKFLKKKGFKIIDTNYKNKIGEIDIIAMDNDYLVFIEVKARMSRAFGEPAEAVDTQKQQKIRNVAELYLLQNDKMENKCRFDVITLLGDEDPIIDHIINAF